MSEDVKDCGHGRPSPRTWDNCPLCQAKAPRPASRPTDPQVLKHIQQQRGPCTKCGDADLEGEI